MVKEQEDEAVVGKLHAELAEARSYVNCLRAAIQEHHDTHYLKITASAARPTNAPHDKRLYDLAGVTYLKPEAWDANPQEYRLAGMRAHWARKQTDVLTVGDPVRVDSHLHGHGH